MTSVLSYLLNRQASCVVRPGKDGRDVTMDGVVIWEVVVALGRLRTLALTVV